MGAKTLAFGSGGMKATPRECPHISNLGDAPGGEARGWVLLPSLYFIQCLNTSRVKRTTLIRFQLIKTRAYQSWCYRGFMAKNFALSEIRKTTLFFFSFFFFMKRNTRKYIILEEEYIKEHFLCINFLYRNVKKEKKRKTALLFLKYSL